MGTDIGMESTDKEAIQKYYGWESASPDNSSSSSSSSSEEEGEVDLEDRILDVENIADSVVFIS